MARASVTWVGVASAGILALSLATLVGCTPTQPASSVSPSPSASASTATPTARPTPATPNPSASGSVSIPGTCTVNELSVTLGRANGAAGSQIVPIVFTNTGSSNCTLTGYPGVSFVGDGNGTQLGAAADEDASVAIVPNSLAPGDTVSAQLRITQAGNYSGSCTVVPADGLRVYPPHSYEAVFVKANNLSACSNADVKLLSVQPVQPGS
jgi:hypothetical protein